MEVVCQLPHGETSRRKPLAPKGLFPAAPDRPHQGGILVDTGCQGGNGNAHHGGVLPNGQRLGRETMVRDALALSDGNVRDASKKHRNDDPVTLN